MQKSYLNMQRYQALQKIMELGSFTKAADALGYTQPALSQMIASLERELSVKLLFRSRYGVQLTPEGEKLFPFIQKTLSQYFAMQETLKEIRGLDTGIIRIGTFSSVSCHWLPPIIKRFLKHYPHVQFILHQGDYGSVAEMVRTGSVDFGFINPDAVSGMHTIVLKEGELMAILPASHPLAEKNVIKLEDLTKEPFLLLEEGNFNEPMEAFQRQGLKPDVRLTLHDDYSILSMVEQDLGVSILPELVLRKTYYNVAIRPLDPPVKRKLGLVMGDKNMIPIASRYFIEYLKDSVDLLP